MMAYVRKHLTTAEAVARRLFSRPEWRRRGIVIAADATPKDTVYLRGRPGAIEVFDIAQGRAVALSKREESLKFALEMIRDGKAKDKTDAEIVAKMREIAGNALKANY